MRVQTLLKHLKAFAVVIAFVLISSFGWQSAPPFKNNSNRELSLHLKEHVRFLSVDIGKRDVFENYPSLIRTADYITSFLEKNGYGASLQEYKIHGRKVSNIIATKDGGDKTKGVVIIGAHYDSCNNPGADDNASGVAALLELARQVAAIELSQTVRFVFFVNEEPPFFKTSLMGSRIYTCALKENKENVAGAVILECLGYYSNNLFSQKYPPLFGFFYPNKGNFIGVVGNIRSRQLVSDITRIFRSNHVPARSLVVDFLPVASFSDHWSFWQEGYRGVMITDTAFMRNSNYHKSTDTFEKLNYDAVAEIVKSLTLWLKKK